MAASTEDSSKGTTDHFKHIRALKDEITSSAVWKDFLSREGGICIVVVTLYFMAKKANDFFDQIEEEMKQNKNKEKKNADMVKKAGLDKVEEEDDEDGSDKEE